MYMCACAGVGVVFMQLNVFVTMRAHVYSVYACASVCTSGVCACAGAFVHMLESMHVYVCICRLVVCMHLSLCGDIATDGKQSALPPESIINGNGNRTLCMIAKYL